MYCKCIFIKKYRLKCLHILQSIVHLHLKFFSQASGRDSLISFANTSNTCLPCLCAVKTGTCTYHKFLKPSGVNTNHVVSHLKIAPHKPT